MPSDAYKHGTVFLWYIVGMVVAFPISIYLFLPVFHGIKTVSVYEYFERRFHRKTRIFTSAVKILSGVCFAGLFTYTTSIAVTQVTGINIWICALSTNTLCILYSALGGFKAVVFSDMLQLLVFLIALLCVFVKGIINEGGFAQIWHTIFDGNRNNIFQVTSSSKSSLTLWPIAVASFFSSIVYLSRQSYVQRCLSTGDLRMARRSAFLGCSMLTAITTILMLIGMTMISKFTDCDPLMSGKVKSYDEATMLFVANTLDFADGLLGFYFAGLICASISSFTSTLNGSVCVIMEDFVKLFYPNLSTLNYLRIAKVVGIFYGILTLLLMFVFQHIRGLFTIIFIINGIFTGPIFGFYVIGMLSPWTSTLPALIGVITSMLFIAFVSIGRVITSSAARPALSTLACNSSVQLAMGNLLNNSRINSTIKYSDPGQSSFNFPLATYHPFWYSCWSTSIAIIVGLLATLIIGKQNPENVDSKLIFRFVTQLVRKCSPKVQKRLGFKNENSSYFQENPKNHPLSTVEFLEKEMVPLKIETW